jgi:hypothetical protein
VAQNQGPHEQQGRAARFRRFAALLGENGPSSTLQAIADRLDGLAHSSAGETALASYRRALMAELDAYLGRARTALELMKYRLRDAPFAVDDLRELSRLCRVEAVLSDATEKRALALRALELAQLAERLERDFGER